MLEVIIDPIEEFDEKTNTFMTTPGCTIMLEHSLVSISKWESKHKKAFLKESEKDTSELIDYIRCMTITKNINLNIFTSMTTKNYNIISEYINDSHTATVINNAYKGKNKDTITSELIYYWMITLKIPMECQKWHLNRLLTLINVIQFKNNPPKNNMTKKEIMARNRALNRQPKGAKK